MCNSVTTPGSEQASLKAPTSKLVHAGVKDQIYLPFPSLVDTDRAGEASLGLLAEGGPDSRTLSAIFLTNFQKKKKRGCISTQGLCIPFISAFLLPLRNVSDRSPTAWGDGRGRGRRCSTLSQSSWVCSTSLVDISPPPLSEIFVSSQTSTRGGGKVESTEDWQPHDIKSVPSSVLRAPFNLVFHSILIKNLPSLYIFFF